MQLSRAASFAVHDITCLVLNNNKQDALGLGWPRGGKSSRISVFLMLRINYEYDFYKNRTRRYFRFINNFMYKLHLRRGVDRAVPVVVVQADVVAQRLDPLSTHNTQTMAAMAIPQSHSN